MARLDSTRPDLSSSSEPVTVDQATFAYLYDRYAPALLGVIAAIVCNETEAVRLLEITFTKIWLQFGQPRPNSQPLFIWLLSIARQTALEARDNQKKLKPPVPVLRLADTGNVLLSASGKSNQPVSTRNTGPQSAYPMNELIEAVLFKNCTPEEAVVSIGLPAATARQQLRLAMQQLRTSLAI